MERDHVYSDPEYRSRLVECQVSRNVSPAVRLRGCNIEAKLTASILTIHASRGICCRNKKLKRKPGLSPSGSKANIEFIHCDGLRSLKGGRLAVRW